METPTSQPRASATASVSVIMISMTLRVPPCRHICRMVARARALIGLKEMLPSSLTQMSLRRSGSTGHFSPPARMASLNARQRAERLRSGSPMENLVPSKWRTTPGPSSSVAA
ncbi:hypothetical protein HDC93_000445 [Streptomyces sp. AK010]|nr:hypothetical protein [Streptomyces sp. AK010]